MKTNFLSLTTSPAFFLLLFLTVFSIPSGATHLGGAELTYTHLTGSQYKVQCAYYRDCFGIAVPPALTLRLSSASCAVDLNFTMPNISHTEITPLCPYDSSTCLGGNAAGIQKWIYEVDVNVPGQCPDWIFSVTDCCRNASITTLQSPAAFSLYVEARLNNVLYDNSSPQFTNDPFMLTCMNDDFFYNNGMFDPDGDSLVYSLVCPYYDSNNCIPYLPGYSAQHPLSSNPPITLDPFTGDYFMHPIAPEIAVIAFQVQDYRNGALIGSVTRDFQVSTRSCTNFNPTLTHMNGTSQQFVWVFPGDTVCFDVFTNDPNNVTDTLTLTWNQVIPAATFVTAGNYHPTGTFCWIPTLADVRSQPWMFTAMVRDDYCPIENEAIFSYFIYVTLDSSLVFLNTSSPEKDFQASVSPNPTTGMLNVLAGGKRVTLELCNQLGECLLRKNEGHFIDLSGLADGIYLLKISDGSKSFPKKVIVKKE